MISLHTPPAIIIPRPVIPFQFFLNGDDCGPCVPRDYAELPKALRWSVPVAEVRPYLPEAYRRLSDGMLGSLLANFGGLPGVIMAGGVKTAWLYTTSDTFRVPANWNKNDNIIHALGAGGAGQFTTLPPVTIIDNFGGTGGGGSAWAALVDAVLTRADLLTVTVATSAQGDSWFIANNQLFAEGGSNGGQISGGSGNGGQGGSTANCFGNLSSNGGDGGDISSGGTGARKGASGGGAGGPNGDGESAVVEGGAGDAGEGGQGGGYAFGGDIIADGDDGVLGPSGGFNPGHTPNAGSGGGGNAGQTVTALDGGNGGDYGAGSGGAGYDGGTSGTPGTPGMGCVLIINNASV